MQRVARFMLWGGLATLLCGLGGCGISCVGGLGAAFAGDQEATSTAGSLFALSFLGMVLGLLSIIVGAILKAIAPKPGED